MTSRQCYEAILIELNKENAPNILLEDFNYLFNKAINQYINKRYNIYDINQQTTDDLRVLKATAILTPTLCGDYGDQSDIGRMMGATYEVNMPSDYLHILNCICIYDVNKTFKCYNKGDVWRRAATRLTADVYSQILDNFWLRPTYRRPYYYIHNVNIQDYVPTNPIRLDVKESAIPNSYDYDPSETVSPGQNKTRYVTSASYQWKDSNFTTNGKYYTATVTYPVTDHKTESYVIVSNHPNTGEVHYANFVGTDVPTLSKKDYIGKTSNLSGELSDLGVDRDETQIVTGADMPGYVIGKSYTANGFEGNISNVERGAYLRYGNKSQVRMEIRYGTDHSLFTLRKVYIDYIKAPQNIRLTQEQLDLTEDTSQMLEFPDYVCQEIINELVHIVMENIADQRLQTHPVVSQSIANPAQGQTEPVAQQG